MGEHWYHSSFKEICFGSNFTDKEITSLLFKIGWGYTLSFVASAIVGKLFGAASVAPYGKFVDTSKITVLRLNAKIAWFLQEIPAFTLPALFYWEAKEDVTITQTIILGMFLIHYFNRSFVFPMFIREGSSVPFLTFIMAFLFCSFNGFFQAHTILYVSNLRLSDIYSPNFIIGLLMYICGLAINVDSDSRLRQLRSKKSANNSSNENESNEETTKKTRYSIPRGGLFELVSAANYFGEICEWWGFALAANLNPSSVWFAGFSTIFLGLRGLDNHRFYRDTFGETYPTNRKAVIPFIF